MGLWIGWNERAKYIYAFFSICMLILIKINHVKLNFTNRNKISFFLLILAYTYITYKDEQLGFRTPFSFYLPIFVLLSIDTNDRIKCLDYIYKWYAWLLVPSIITYILYQTIGLPSFGSLLVTDDIALPTEYVTRENYIFYNYAEFYEIRFNGPFIEPGHLGMMSAFLLFATGFDFRKIYTWTILVGILLTLSLSGYMLAFLGYALYQYGEGKVGFKFFILAGLFTLIVLITALTYNDGDNLFMEKIIMRLEPDEENGFAGNNRVFGQIDLYFVSLFTDFKLLLFGYDKETIEYLRESGSRGTGFIMWMVMHGLIGTISAFLFYFSYSVMSKFRKISFLSFLFVLVVFWQRSYPFWFSWIICFTYGISYHEYMFLKKRK